MKITIEDFKDYVAGWLICNQGDFPDDLTLGNMKAALNNALSQIECDQDGVHATVRRAKFHQKELDFFQAVRQTPARDETPN